MSFFQELKWLAEDMYVSTKDKASSAAEFVKENPGKAALGAAVGVAAVAAAPFTGGGSVAGAATLGASLTGAGAAATAAGATGVAVSAAVNSKQDADRKKEKAQAYKRGEQKAKAEMQKKLEALRDELASMLKSIEHRENFLLTCFAVGVCAANADGEICANERVELEELVTGIGKMEKASLALKTKVSEWYKKPPNLNTVWGLIEEKGFNDRKHIEMFDTIVHMVVEADDDVNSHEQDFITAWNYKAA